MDRKARQQRCVDVSGPILFYCNILTHNLSFLNVFGGPFCNQYPSYMEFKLSKFYTECKLSQLFWHRQCNIRSNSIHVPTNVKVRFCLGPSGDSISLLHVHEVLKNPDISPHFGQPLQQHCNKINCSYSQNGKRILLL